MIWFKSFIKYVIRKWNKSEQLTEAILQNPAIEAALTTKQIGDIGENYIADLLRQKDYFTTVSCGSRSPSDVWSFCEYDEFVHIALVQTKSAYFPNTPKKINENDIVLLEAFASYVYDSFDEYYLVPDALKSSDRIVSFGYARVWIQGTRKKHEAGFLNAFYTSGLEDCPRIKRVIAKVHKLDDNSTQNIVFK